MFSPTLFPASSAAIAAEFTPSPPPANPSPYTIPPPPPPHIPTSRCHADLTWYHKNSKIKLKMVKLKNEIIFMNYKNMDIFNTKIMPTLNV
jgi:hypothetical protein